MFTIKKVFIIIILLFTNIIYAESNLNEILVSPGQRSTTIFDSLNSVEVITADDIQSLGYSTVDEILSHSSSINIVTTFVLTPLTYLGGTFYSIASLPQVWQDISVFNPIAYIISSYRLAFLGVEETSLVLSLSVIISLIIILFVTALMLLSRGTGIKN